MKKGFTLLELLIVVIVIAILATFAIPQYLKAVERAKEAKGKHNLSLIAQAEKMYRAENDVYLNFGADPGTTALNDYVELLDVDADTDWDYSVAGATASAFTATATRVDGPNAAETIVLNQNGVWTDNFTP